MIRIAKDTDAQAIDRYCAKHGMATPQGGIVFISEDETGNINGLIVGQQQMIIEPMVADNPTVSRRLYDHLLGAVQILGTKMIWCIPNKSSLVEELEKMGYISINTNVSILEKRL